MSLIKEICVSEFDEARTKADTGLSLRTFEGRWRQWHTVFMNEATNDSTPSTSYHVRSTRIAYYSPR
ncbi:hypothetical protein HJFPF1_00617 [Paramyrothecium foliicola]|nr:hypothetical protein HJFPF1_00617 [Paramyrothecium foliicola]